MVFIRFFRKKNRQVFDETPLQRMVRMVLVGALFTAVLWGFWINTERRLEQVRGGTEKRADATATLTEAQEEQLREFTRKVFEAYGVVLIVSVRNTPFGEGALESAGKAGAVFLGLCPAKRQVLFHVPPLVGKALGEPLILYLRLGHFMPYFAAGNWPEGLAAALNLIGKQLERHIRGNAAE